MHRIALSHLEAINACNRLLTEVELITDLSKRTENEDSGRPADSEFKVIPGAERWAYHLPDLIFTVANLVLETNCLSAKDSSTRAFCLLQQLLLKCFYTYPSCVLTLAEGVGYAVLKTVETLACSSAIEKETLLSMLNDVGECFFHPPFPSFFLSTHFFS